MPNPAITGLSANQAAPTPVGFKGSNLLIQDILFS